MVLGAGLYAANLSTTFKLRKFRMSDGATYPVVFQVATLLDLPSATNPAGVASNLCVQQVQMQLGCARVTMV